METTKAVQALLPLRNKARSITQAKVKRIEAELTELEAKEEKANEKEKQALKKLIVEKSMSMHQVLIADSAIGKGYKDRLQSLLQQFPALGDPATFRLEYRIAQHQAALEADLSAASFEGGKRVSAKPLPSKKDPTIVHCKKGAEPECQSKDHEVAEPKKEQKEEVKSETEAILTDCYLEFKGFVYLNKKHSNVERKAWGLIATHFQPVPEFDRFTMFDCEFNQKHAKLPKFGLSSGNLQQVFDRLKVLHGYLVHGDLKAEHIRVNNKGEIVFVDFDACSFADSERHTPQFASLELLLSPRRKYAVDDLEAVLWACYDQEVDSAPLGERQQHRVVSRLTRMSKILSGAGPEKLRAAFIHVWALPRQGPLEDGAYVLPQTLAPCVAQMENFQSEIVSRVVGFQPRKPLSNDSGDKILEGQKIASEWDNFFAEQSKQSKKTEKAATKWVPLEKDQPSSGYDLMLLNNERGCKGVPPNVRPLPKVEGFKSDLRQPFLAQPLGALALLATSVATRRLEEVCSKLVELLPRDHRALHVLLAFSCVILKHKDKGELRVSVNENTLVRCLRTGNLAAIVLAASGRFVIYAHDGANVDFVRVVTREISREHFPQDTLAVGSRCQVEDEEQEELRRDKQRLKQEREEFSKEKEQLRKEREEFSKEQKEFWKEREQARNGTNPAATRPKGRGV